MQALVPSYLEVSLETLTREQEKYRKHMTDAFGGEPFKAMEQQAKQNLAMFEQAMSMFVPFGANGPANTGDQADAARKRVKSPTI